MNNLKVALFGCLLLGMQLHAQDKKPSWKSITETKDASWFESEQAKMIADNVVLYQRDNGGWPKNIEMQDELTAKQKQQLLALKSDPNGCTIDNGATCQELLFLSKVYKKHPDDRYKTAFLKGILYLIAAQYKNGGWPQYYPLKEGYYSHITYNDNAMVNVLQLFKEIKDKTGFYAIDVPNDITKRVAIAFNKGIECILKTQYKQNGVLTAWCAQHDKESLLPAKAREYELPSLSGKESAKIVLLLMAIDKPSPEIVLAIEAAVAWFDNVKITGIKLETMTIEKTNITDKIVVASDNAEPLWARFMELNNNSPFFCDRNGKKKYSLAEISHERRNGYAWYTNEPKEVFKKYESWKKAIEKP